jgi:hypothetical protein
VQNWEESYSVQEVNSHDILRSKVKHTRDSFDFIAKILKMKQRTQNETQQTVLIVMQVKVRTVSFRKYSG